MRAAARRAIALCALAAVALLSAAAGAAQPVARMGSHVLTDVELRRVLDEARASGSAVLDADLDAVIKTELLRKALLAEALEQGWDRRPEVLRRIERAREQAIVTAYANHLARPPADYPDRAEIEKYYNDNPAQFAGLTELRLAQIFIAAAGDAQTRAGARQRADAIAAGARAPGADFAELARRHSEHRESAVRGGEIGWVRADNLYPALRAELSALKPGGVSDPVAAPQGWHIVKLLEARAGKPASLEQARESIVAILRLRRAAQLERAHYERMLERTPLSIDSAVLNTVIGKPE